MERYLDDVRYASSSVATAKSAVEIARYLTVIFIHCQPPVTWELIHPLLVHVIHNHLQTEKTLAGTRQQVDKVAACWKPHLAEEPACCSTLVIVADPYPGESAKAGGLQHKLIHSINIQSKTLNSWRQLPNTMYQIFLTFHAQNCSHYYRAFSRQNLLLYQRA